LDTYDHLQNKIDECDKEIGKMLDEIIHSDDKKRQHYIEAKPHKRVNKNTPKGIDLNLKAYQMFEGTDLLAIEGMSFSTVLALMGEAGIEGIKKFKTGKHFASWLRLAPNNKEAGEKYFQVKSQK